MNEDKVSRESTKTLSRLPLPALRGVLAADLRTKDGRDERSNRIT